MTPYSRGDLIVQAADHEVFRAVRAEFVILRFNGKVTAALFAELRNRILQDARFLAIDAAGLLDPGFPLARELGITARRMRNSGGQMVVINPPGRFRDYLRSTAPDDAIAFLPSENLLDTDARPFPQRLQEIRALLARLRRELEQNPLWKLADREGLWLCPFCGALQDQIRAEPRLPVSDATVDRVYLHVAEQCVPCMAHRPPRTLQELNEALHRINQDKLLASKNSATALATRVIQLQDRAKVADELEQSLVVATERQKHLLPPRPPEIPGLSIAIEYHAAQKVSGDFYDFIDLGDGRLGFLVGDVSGHGLEAGIVMGVAKKLVQIRTRDTGDPVKALQMANRDLAPDLDRKTFVSAFLAVYDPKGRSLSCVRAGHNPPVLFNPGRPSPLARIEPNGLVLGLDPGPRFNDSLVLETLEVQAGDTLLLYTDGLPEAVNPAGEEFGMERVCGIVRANPGVPPDALLRLLLEEFQKFRGEKAQEDDVTAICVRWA